MFYKMWKNEYDFLSPVLRYQKVFMCKYLLLTYTHSLQFTPIESFEENHLLKEYSKDSFQPLIRIHKNVLHLPCIIFRETSCIYRIKKIKRVIKWLNTKRKILNSIYQMSINNWLVSPTAIRKCEIKTLELIWPPTSVDLIVVTMT